MKVTTSIVFRQISKNKSKKNTYPVELQIYFSYSTRYYRTGKSLLPDEWEKVDVSRPRGEYKELKNYFNEVERKAVSIINDLDSFSFEAFSLAWYERSSEKDSVYQGFKNKIKELRKIGTPSANNTADGYTDSLNSFKAFRKKKKLAYTDVTPKFLEKYEAWMFGKDLSPSTVGKHCRAMRHIMQRALKQGKIKKHQYPFDAKDESKYAIPMFKAKKSAAKVSDIKKLISIDLEGQERFSKDIWLLLYYGNGANLKDVCYWDWSNVNGNVLSFVRKKTSRTRKHQQESIQVFLNDHIKYVINEYGRRERKGRVFIFLDDCKSDPAKENASVKNLNKLINKYLKRISQRLELSLVLKTSNARHSFANTLEKSGVGLKQLKDLLGHSNIKTTEIYLKSILEEKELESISNRLVSLNEEE